MVIIQKLNGERTDLSQYGFTKLVINPIDIIYDSENIIGRPGRNRVESYHGVRSLQLTVNFQAKNIMETYDLENMMSELFDYAEPFYIYDQILLPYKFELPGQKSMSTSLKSLERSPITYKRFLVERINNTPIQWDHLSGKRVIELETSDLPYPQTPFTSLQMQNNVKEWDVGLHDWNLGLIDWDNDPTPYTFTQNNHIIKNLGNVKVNPRYCDLKITITGIFDSYVQITNRTTNETFRYNGNLINGDILEINGINYTKNGISVINSTNLNLLSLVKGDNIIFVEGSNNFRVSFDFPFYYIQ